MPDRILPDEVPEIGYIYISLGLDAEGGITVGYDHDGMTDETAIGYLIAYSDVLRRENEISWMASTAGLEIDDEDPGDAEDD